MAIQPSLHHVRELIKHLDHDQLCSKGIINPISSYLPEQIWTVKNYPPWVYKGKNSIPNFGMTMDYIIRAYFFDNLTEYQITDDHTTVKDNNMKTYLDRYSDHSLRWNQKIEAIYHLSHSHYGEVENSFTLKDLSNYIPTLTNICKEICKQFEQYSSILGTKLLFGTEYNVESKTGHPDIITVNDFGIHCIFEIKNTRNFNNIANETYLQLFSYASLLRKLGKTVQYLGFILPMQRSVFVVSIENWDETPFYNKLSSAVLIEEQKRSGDLITNVIRETMEIVLDDDLSDNQSQEQDLLDIEIILDSTKKSKSQKNKTKVEQKQSRVKNSGLLFSLINLSPEHTENLVYVGTHWPRQPSIVNTFHSFLSYYPLNNNYQPAIQLFLRGNLGGNSAINEKEIDEAREVVTNFNLPFFTHTPYTINLCNPILKNGFNSIQWIQDDLRLTSSMGGRGVVVHVGKSVKQPLDQALIKMKQSIHESLPYATEQCPFLIETPASQGTETLNTLEQMSQFYYSFTEDERKKIGICIDTCHVWASGYDPLEYIENWIANNGPNAIKLIHFNDSVEPKGSRKDRHAQMGAGTIGADRLNQVIKLSIRYKFPIVKEY